MAKCAMCTELREERDRILKFTKKDKIAFHKEEKWYKIAIACLIGVIAIMVGAIIIISIGVDDSIKVLETIDKLRG